MIWSTNHKEIWIFVIEQVTGTVCSKFCHSNVHGFQETHYVHKTRTCKLLNILLHIIPTKVDPDNLKGCQICNDHINYNLHIDHGIVICHKWELLTINIYFIIIIFEAKFMCLFTFDTNITFFSKYPDNKCY